MKARICGFFLIVATVFGFASAAQTPQQPKLGSWWNEQAPGAWPYRANAKKLPPISVKGNKFVDPNGNVMLFRGLSISDPDKLASQGHWSRDHFVKVQEMGAKVVRIPVHPVAWRGRTPSEYIKLLDQAVDWCTELNMYIMLDWHSIGNLTTGLFQDPMYETTLIKDWQYTLTPSGEFAKKIMRGELKLE
jgi:endoglucanase